MFGYDCRNKCVFSFWRNDVSDGADWTSTGRLFQSRGPAAANEWSPTVTSRDGRTSRRLEVDERGRPRRLDGRSATYCSWLDKYCGAVPWRARYTNTMTVSLNLMHSKPVKTGERICYMLRPTEAIDRVDPAAALKTDWRRLSREAGRPANVALP